MKDLDRPAIGRQAIMQRAADAIKGHNRELAEDLIRIILDYQHQLVIAEVSAEHYKKREKEVQKWFVERIK